jgi:hypothetical protein
MNATLPSPTSTSPHQRPIEELENGGLPGIVRSDEGRATEPKVVLESRRDWTVRS